MKEKEHERLEEPGQQDKREKDTELSKVLFTDSKGTFRINQPENVSCLYFPIAGEGGIKCSVTPNLGGDIKMDQNTFLTEPVSAENLHNNRSGRNFWCRIEGLGAWSAVGASAEEESKKFTREQDESRLNAGFMWQRVSRKSGKYGLKADVTSFVPLEHNVEILFVELGNTTVKTLTLTPTAAVPIYARSADNIRDHRHVTSLLHRIRTTDYGVYVKPTLSFDERGHQKNSKTYFVCGVTGKGEKPQSFYPVAEEYLGEGGSYTNPRRVLEGEAGAPAGACFAGKEAMGGIRFPTVSLQPGEKASYILVMGVETEEAAIEKAVLEYASEEQVKKALRKTEAYWQKKVNVRFHTGSSDFDCLMRWICFQPILRRLYGCSFLPHHDYGRGGRGWRDLWQDCLSLLIMDPGGVRQMILDNYGGVRMDGTNATIIGAGQGEFVADRNGIARVWMDHGVWPFMTTKLYIDQTGNLEILEETAPYFKDGQTGRGEETDPLWEASYGVRQRCENGEEYRGSILEHILLQHLCAFYEVGEHNHIRLRGADWNDALDMAWERGESVAFTCAYAGNLTELSALLTLLEERLGRTWVELYEEVEILLADSRELYESVRKKREVLQSYLGCCRHDISGKKIRVPIKRLAENLRHKAEWMGEHIRRTEWIGNSQEEGWFNSYYDNNGEPVEGRFGEQVRMMLTGQVFAVMSGVADHGQIGKISKAADRYLYQKEIGGYRLNTDFQEEKYSLGRMFGFAYGEKENGAVFSHMAVMYANALYRRGFVREGHQALSALSDAALNFETARIYPGIPEYFNGSGRGMYHYLTGAASWYMLTMVAEVFGVHGEAGDMVIRPRLTESEFDRKGSSGIELMFGGRAFRVTYRNPSRLSYGEYTVKGAVCDCQKKMSHSEDAVFLAKEEVEALSEGVHEIEIELG